MFLMDDSKMEKITEHDARFEYTVPADLKRVNVLFHDFCGTFSVRKDTEGYQYIVVEEKLSPGWQLENTNPVSYYYEVWGRMLTFHTSRNEYIERGITQDLKKKTNIGVLVIVAIIEIEQSNCIFRASIYQDNHGAGMKFIESLEDYLFNVYPKIHPTKSAIRKINHIDEQQSKLTDYMPEQKLLIDQACTGWADRGYQPQMNMSEYLQNFFENKGLFLSKDQFKVALRDAGRRGLIEKKNRRWRKPDK